MGGEQAGRARLQCYSDIAVTKSGTILCFYGRGEKTDFGGYAFNISRSRASISNG